MDSVQTFTTEYIVFVYSWSPSDRTLWVKYSDVESLQARVSELEFGLDVLHRIAIGALGNPINDCTKYLNEIASRARSLKGTP